ncbi:MAG TPA: CoA transferase [Myxococcota bacterium]|nr:CoA transferase [Myxococcota bacterium]
MRVEFGGPPTGPLTGIRVVDLSTVVSGPLCTQVLGDLGAEVWKVEPLAGDTTRRLGPPFRGGLTGFFAHFNRNKRSIALDLKCTEGQHAARRLALRADVLVENYRPAVVTRLGLGYEELSRENPRLVYLSINGFGPSGPYCDLPAYDTVIQGLAGFMPTQGGDGTPQLVKSIIADKATALTAAYAVMAALLARERGDGRGQHVQVPMLDAFAAFMLPDVITKEAFKAEDATPRPKLPDVHRTWETADGHVVLLVLEDHQFAGLCRAIRREDLLDDPRCKSLLTRIMHGRALYTILEEELRKWPTAELLERARHFGAPLAPVNAVSDFLRDPQVQSNETVLEVPDSEAGPMRFLRNPVRFARTPASLRQRPPRLGEQTDAILTEAGFTSDEIAQLRAERVIA